MTVYSILIELYSITFINFPSFNLSVRIIFGDFAPLCYLVYTSENLTEKPDMLLVTLP